MKSFALLSVIGIVLSLSATQTFGAKIYNPEIGTKAVYYSGAAYCANQTVQSWTCGQACRAEPDVD